MKLGISSYSYGWSIGKAGYPKEMKTFSCMDLIRKAVDLKIFLVQIADNLPLHKQTEKELIELKDLSEEYGISLETGTKGIDTAHIQKYIDISTFLNSSILRCVIDTAENKPTPEETIVQLEKLVPFLERSQVKLAIENHDRFTADTLNYILDRIDTNFIGICYDTANSFGCLEGPMEVLEKLENKIINVHIKDIKVDRLPHKYGFTIYGSPAGYGQLDIKAIINKLRSIKSDPNVILELWTPPEQNMDQTVKKEQEWVRKSIMQLRKIIKQ